MTNLYDFKATDIDGKEVDLADLQGKVALVVNTASKCGFTPQYEGLEELQRTYGEQGLVVLGFPCDQFAHQEPGDDAAIEQFCTINYGVTFPLSTKVDVNGRKTHPVFAFLRKRTGSLLGSTVKWNFTKFLVAPDGTTVKRYSPKTEPAAMAKDIEALMVDAAA
jgi:glutathione peroxidase